MALTEATGAIAAATAGGLIGYMFNFEPYIPYFFGGVALLSYMVARDEIKLKSFGAIGVILGAMLAGYLSLGLANFLAELFLDKVTTLTMSPDAIAHSNAITSGDLLNSIKKIISFAFGALSRTVFLGFFANRQNIFKRIVGDKRWKS